MDGLWAAWAWIAEEAMMAMAAPNAAQELRSLASLPPPPKKGKAFTSTRGGGAGEMARNTTLGLSKSQKHGAPRTHSLKVPTAALGALATMLAQRKKSYRQRPKNRECGANREWPHLGHS